MKRLADGVFAEVDTEKETCGVLRIGKDRVRAVPFDQHEALIALAHGLDDDDESAEELFAALQAERLAGVGLPAVDEKVVRTLTTLGAPFLWTLGGNKEATGLLNALREARSVRKLFFKSFGQTECLPESAIARCLALREDLGGTDADILLVGDDDLLSVPLSMMGFRVTSIDIDPVLIAFLARERDRQGLRFTPRVYDVLAPLDMALFEQFDAVLTDPMSFHDCQIAFLSRALAVVKPGGHVLVCVHPYGRLMFDQVVSEIPAHAVRYRSMLSAYSYYRYAENSYRSDLCTLVKDDGPLPYTPADTIPFEALTTGQLTWANHSGLSTPCHKLGPIRRVTADTLRDALAALDLGYTVEAVHTVEGTVHAFLTHTEKPSRVLLRINPRAATLDVDAVPHNAAATQLALVLVQELKAKDPEGFAMTGLFLPTPVLAPADEPRA